MDDLNPTSRQVVRREVRRIPEIQKEGTERIKTWMAVCLIIFAISVDLTEFLTTWLGLVQLGGLLSTIISSVAGFIFWIWYLILGVPAISNPKQFVVRFSTFIIEIIPFIDAIPFISWAWTIGTIVTIIMTRSEDKGGIISKATGFVQGKID